MVKKRRTSILIAWLLLLALSVSVPLQSAQTVLASDASSSAQRGWEKVDGKRYFTGADGEHRTGWFTFKGKKFYLDPAEDGAAVTGLKKIEGKNYCFNDIGHLVVNRRFYQAGKSYYAIDASGVAVKLPRAGQLAVKQLKKFPQATLRSAFNWAANLPYKPTSTRTPEQFAIYGFNQSRGDCNVQACTFWCMARVLGYDAHYMKGTVPQANGTDGNHAWVEIDIEGKTWVFDPNFAGQYSSQFGKNTGWKFEYGTKNTYKYQNITRVN